MSNHAVLRNGRQRSAAFLLSIVALSAAFVLSSVLPASAHYELNETNPAADSTIEALPEQMTLVFSGPLITTPEATSIQVVDAEGTSYVSGAASVEGTTVTQPLSGDPSGPLTVTWQVVFDDGHPFTNSFTFTVTPPTPTAEPTSEPTETAEPTAEPTAEASADAEPDADAGDTVPWIPILIGAVVVAVIAVIAVNVIRRSRGSSASS